MVRSLLGKTYSLTVIVPQKCEDVKAVEAN